MAQIKISILKIEFTCSPPLYNSSGDLLLVAKSTILDSKKFSNRVLSIKASQISVT